MKKYISNELLARALTLFLTFTGIVYTNAQVSYSFTPCGAVGQVGPTQGVATTAYGSTNLAGLVTILGTGYQQWTVPATGNYKIQAIGASGGSINVTCSPTQGGRGADISGEYNLTAGQVLLILVGQKGSSNFSDAGGGGGSYVASSTSVAMVVAGGGGGSSNNVGSCGGSIAGINASTLTSGTAGNGGGGAGGTAGSGGVQTSAGGGGAGGGFSTDGTGGGNFGKAFMTGGNGGTGSNVDHGGFGGGGSGWYTGGNGGGGGGYSGGGTAGTSPYSGGGGGGSYNTGTNPVHTLAAGYGDGMVVITKLCNVNIIASSNPICAGQTVSLTTNATSNIVWSTGPTTASISVTPLVNTSYTVTGQAATGCTTSVVMEVTVHPVPALEAIVNPTVLCVGNTATVTASGANSYTWTSPSVLAPSFTIDPAATSVYSYSGTNQFGCISSTVVSVVVNTNVLGITSNTSVCSGKSLNVVANGASTYTWSTGSFFASTFVSPTVITSYTVTGTDQHNCILSNFLTVTVNNKPAVTANSNKNSVCKGESVTLTAGGASTYSWSNGSAAAVTNVTLPVDVTYIYTVTGTDINGCIETATVMVVSNKCSGINELDNSGSLFHVYPNPTSGVLTIELNNNSSSNTAEVTDLCGRTVMSVSGKESTFKIDMHHLAEGVYYVKVISEHKTQVIKVVKNN